MMKMEDLHTSDEHFEAIWDVLGRSKEGTLGVSVPRSALKPVMMDHSRLLGEVIPTIYTKQKVTKV